MKVYREMLIEAEHIETGDKIEIELDGNRYRSTAVHRDGDTVLFLTDDVICNRAMNEKHTTDGGYDNTDLRKYLDKLTKTIPDDFINQMAPFDNGDYLRPLSLQEVFGLDDDFNETDGQIEWFKDCRHRIAYYQNDRADWWLRSVTSASLFAFVYGGGHAGYNNASDTWVGVRPAFMIYNP